MHIKRLKLENFRGFAKASVDFPEGNVAVFFGWNGAGKTAVLDAVAVAFKFLLQYEDAAVGFHDFEDDDIQVGKNFASIGIVVQDNPLVVVKKYIGGVTTCDGLGLTSLFSKGESEALPMLVYYRTNRETTLPSPPFPLVLNGSDRRRNLAYKDFFDSGFDVFQNLVDWIRFEEDLENQQKIERRDFNWENLSLKPIRRSLSIFLSKMDADFSGLKVQRQSNGAIDFSKPSQQSELYIQKAGQDLKLSQLSSGERSLILLVADIARRATILNPQLPDPLQSDGIVLIDEIELHLHPKWQRTVIPALRATFPNIQFIIATHSPQVLSEVENGAVFEIDNFQIRPRHTYGRDNDWVLHVIMEDEERPKEVQADLEEYFALLRSDQLDAAARLRQQIEAKIGTDDPELVKADILVRRKERTLTS